MFRYRCWLIIGFIYKDAYVGKSLLLFIVGTMRPHMQITKEVIGNGTDDRWFQELTFENGKPNLAACLILAEIRYWYTPTEVKDEHTGNIIGFKKKFKSDLHAKKRMNILYNEGY